MKKILAAALALSLSAAMFTACGYDSSSSSSSSAATTTTTTTAAESSSVAEEASSADASSADESTADASSEGDASSAEGGEAAETVDIAEAVKSFKNYDNAQIKFTADTDISALVKDMQEGFASIKSDAACVEAGEKANKKGKMEPFTKEDFDKIWTVKGKLYGIDASYDGEYVQKVLADDTKDLQYISGDESRVKYSIEEVGGVPMLKMEVLDKYPDGVNYLIPKPQFKLAEIFKGHEDLLPKVNTVKFDMIQRAVGDFVADDGTALHVPGNFMGTIAVQAQKNGKMTWEQNDFDAGWEEVNDWVYVEGSTQELLVWKNSDFANTTEDQFVTFMRWGIPNDACVYIADIAFYDVDGNPITW